VDDYQSDGGLQSADAHGLEDPEALADRATKSDNPVARQELYILAERILCETEAAVIPLYLLWVK